jgi:C4-dicarboxylate transporter, DctM subunit
VAIGSIMLPAMLKNGYPKRFAVGVISTSGSLGILIPPSIVLIIYAVSTSESAGRMFLAGMVPGAMLAGLLMLITYVAARAKKFPTMPRANAREIWTSFREAFWGLLLVVIVLGGIYGGFFTPTEAAAVSAVYAFVAAVWIYGGLKLRQVPKVLLSAANTSAMLLYIITNAILFSFLLTSEQIPQSLAEWVVSRDLSPWMFLLLLNIALLIAGQFMEPTGIILILAPLVLPIALALGIDPVHLGIVMTINLEIGMISPPVGLNLFVASHMARMGMTQVAIAAAPWAVALIGFLLLITYVPQISLWLPNLVYG